MTKPQPDTKPANPRGALARPLDSLVFLLPLIIFYEVSCWYAKDRVIAFHLLRTFFELFGQVGTWAPALAVVIILLATHAASKEKWRVHWKDVFVMYLEAIALAMPLLLLNQMIDLSATQDAIASRLDNLALGIGAGVYEELVFRLILISLLIMIGVDVMRLSPSNVAISAVVLSSLIFAAHHHLPFTTEPFDAMRFLFRTLSGIYLAGVFWYRGYGPAAGCHAAYNVAVVFLAG